MKDLKELIGEKIWFGKVPQTKEFYKEYFNWMNDPKIKSNFYIPKNYTLEEIAEDIKYDEEDSNSERWCIYQGKYPLNNFPIGEAVLISLDENSEFKKWDKDYILKSKELDEIIIEKNNRKGYGTEAMNLILNHVFKENKSLYLQVYPENLPAIGLYKKFGFKEIAKDISNLTGKEVAIMRLISEDWKKV